MIFNRLFPKRLVQKRRAKSQRPAEPQLIELLEQRSLLAAANPLISIGGVAPTILPEVNGKQLLALVHGNATHLYTTNGTQAGTVEFLDMAAALTIPANGVFSDYAILGTEMYFSAVGTSGNELWKTNGTAAGTKLVLDINPGTADSSPAGFEIMNGFVYFAATNATTGRELWRTNGLAAGTTLVSDVTGGTGSSDPIRLQTFDNHLFFGTGDRLSTWRTDGTSANTSPIVLSDWGSSLQNLPEIGTYPVGVVNGRLIVKRELQAGIDLLSYSTATAVPEVIHNIPATWVATYVIDQFAVAGNQMYFREIPFLHGDKDWTGDLWVTNGTADGTTKISGNLFQKPPYKGVVLPFPHGFFNDAGVNKLVFRDTGSGPFSTGYSSSTLWTSGTSLNAIQNDTQTMIGNLVQFGNEMFGLASIGLLRIDSSLQTSTVVPAYTPNVETPSGLVVMQGGLWFQTDVALWKYNPNSPTRIAGPAILAPGAFVGPAAGQTFPDSALFDWTDVAGAVAYDVIFDPESASEVIRVTASQYVLPSIRLGTQTVRVRAVLSNGEISEVSSHSFIGVGAPQNVSASEFPLEQAIQVSTTDQQFTNGFVHILDGETNERILWQTVIFPAGANRQVRIPFLYSSLPGHHRLIVKVSSSLDVSAPGTTTTLVMRTRSVVATFNTATNVTLSWPLVAGAVNYDIWVDDDVNKIRSFLQAPNLPTNSYTGNFPSSTYRVWVRARFEGGDVTLWSIAAGFTTGGTMRLMNPTGTIQDNKGDELFVLSEVNGATGYELWVNDVTTGNRILHDANIPANMTSYLPATSLGPGHYAVWVRPKFAGNTVGAWSPVRNFTIQASRQIAVTPFDGPMLDRTPQVTWQTVPWATSYTVYISGKTSGLSFYRQVMSAGSGAHTVTTPLVDGDYNVWVQAKGANGLISPWATAKSLTIGFGRTNSVPSLTMNRTLTWAAVAGADHYDLWVDYLDPSGPIQSQIVRRADLTTNSFALPANLFAGPYRAWVRAIGTHEGFAFTSNWSAQGTLSL
jgi:ELWxxDGT repeat protein